MHRTPDGAGQRFAKNVHALQTCPGDGLRGRLAGHASYVDRALGLRDELILLIREAKWRGGGGG